MPALDIAINFMISRNKVKGRLAEPIDYTSIQVVKFKDGKASEHWEYIEMKNQ